MSHPSSMHNLDKKNKTYFHDILEEEIYLDVCVCHDDACESSHLPVDHSPCQHPAGAQCSDNEDKLVGAGPGIPL